MMTAVVRSGKFDSHSTPFSSSFERIETLSTEQQTVARRLQLARKLILARRSWFSGKSYGLRVFRTTFPRKIKTLLVRKMAAADFNRNFSPRQLPLFWGLIRQR